MDGSIESESPLVECYLRALACSSSNNSTAIQRNGSGTIQRIHSSAESLHTMAGAVTISRMSSTDQVYCSHVPATAPVVGHIHLGQALTGLTMSGPLQQHQDNASSRTEAQTTMCRQQSMSGQHAAEHKPHSCGLKMARTETGAFISPFVGSVSSLLAGIDIQRSSSGMGKVAACSSLTAALQQSLQQQTASFEQQTASGTLENCSSGRVGSHGIRLSCSMPVFTGIQMPAARVLSGCSPCSSDAADGCLTCLPAELAAGSARQARVLSAISSNPVTNSSYGSLGAANTSSCQPTIPASHPFALSQMRRNMSSLDFEASSARTGRVLGSRSNSYLPSRSLEEFDLLAIPRKYTPEERVAAIARYRAKRDRRNFSRTVKYKCRKSLADSRPRVRGRFARNGDPESVLPHQTKKAQRELQLEHQQQAAACPVTGDDAGGVGFGSSACCPPGSSTAEQLGRELSAGSNLHFLNAPAAPMAVMPVVLPYGSHSSCTAELAAPVQSAPRSMLPPLPTREQQQQQQQQQQQSNPSEGLVGCEAIEDQGCDGLDEDELALLECILLD